jgi:lipid II:glycine glycyltransferase (peptidoglycan interpeptide bridge formation enzyme)
MMRHARDRGVRLHDLWGVAPSRADAQHAWYGVGLFKKGFGGSEVRWAGTWDIVISPRLYRLRAAVGQARAGVRGVVRRLHR